MGDEDALRGEKVPLFDDRSPLVLSVDWYDLFPGRTYGMDRWTITIGKDRTEPRSTLQSIRQSVTDIISSRENEVLSPANMT